MGRWTQYDEDDYRLPEGMKRTGYDADSERYYFRDREGLAYKGPEGSQFGVLTLVSEMPSSIPQEVDEDSDLEAAPIGTDGHRLLALDERGTRYNPRASIAHSGSLRLSNSVPRQLHLGSKTVISQHDKYRPKYSPSTSDLEGFNVIQGQESSGSNNVSGYHFVFGTVGGADISSQGLPAATPVPEVTVPPSPAPAAAPVPSQPATPAAPQVHIVSNARGVYPQLGMFSVPRRSHTIGHLSRRGTGHHDDRSVDRILRKLSKMGFTEGTYPKLKAKVTEQTAAHPLTTKDGEDDIVTNLIEELIPSTSSAWA